jgi:HTH-type transcriptional regulator / antitoxin MqsA
LKHKSSNPETLFVMRETCRKCGSPLVKHTKKEVFNYKNKSLSIDASFLKCSKCKTEIDMNAEERLKQRRRLELSVDGYLTDEDIRRIRKKLGLTQKEMEVKLGVGSKTFARYENLSVRQSRAMDNLLRILEVYPEAIRIL